MMTSKVSLKAQNFPTYEKRAGTNDFGKEFEYMMCALHALKLSTNKDIIDFEMTTNDKKYGDFDDICLKIKTKDQTKIVLLQLKHKENKNYITNKNLASLGNEFSLLKYLKSFENFNFEDPTCIVYTNSSAKLQNDSQFPIKTQEMGINVKVRKEMHFDLLSVLQPDNPDEIFQFELTQQKFVFKKLDKFSQNFFLLTSQANVKVVKHKVQEMLCSLLLDRDVCDSFVLFMKEWWSGRFVLTKRDVIAKLTELALSPWVKTISAEKANSKTRLLCKSILDHDMTIVKNVSNSVVSKIWGSSFKEEDFKKTAQKYRLGKNNMTGILWFLDLVPLIVEVNDENMKQVKHIVKFLEHIDDKKKLVVIGNLEKKDFPGWKVLENLKDFHSQPNIYSKILRKFRLILQGRKSINLEELLANCEDFIDCIEMDELIKMTQNVLQVGKLEKKFPKCYVPRKVSAVFVDIKKILKELEDVNGCILIINCDRDFRNTLNVTNAEVIELEIFLKDFQRHDSRNLILVSTNKQCSYAEFESVYTWKNNLNVYLVQIVEKDCCTLLLSKGKELISEGNICQQQIEESEIFRYCNSQLNVFCASPGMGKSTLFTVLSRKVPTDFWVLHIRLADFNNFLKIKPNLEQALEYFLILNYGNNEFAGKLSRVFSKHKKIFLLMDGIDEVDSHYVDNLLDITRSLSRQGFYVWISSRESLKERILQQLDLYSLINIQELCEREQTNYIERRLKMNYDSSEIEEISKAIFTSSDIANSRQLLGIPLQLYIITENFLTNSNLASTLREENVFVLTKMYKLFFEGKRGFCYKKIGMDRHQEQIGYSFKQHVKLYEGPALQVCFDGEDFKKLNLDEEDFTDFIDDIKTRGDKFGIIKCINEENIAIFTHQTYAEYFACVWLVRNLKKMKALADKWFSERYENLRLIFDIMLSEQSFLHLSVIYKNVEHFREHCEDRSKDKAGRDALYLICCYGMKYPPPIIKWVDVYTYSQISRESKLYMEMVNSLLEQCQNIREEDKLFGISYYEYSLKSRCLYVLEACLEKKFLSFEDIDILKYYTYETLAYYASQSNYHNLLDNVLKRFNCNNIRYRDSYGSSDHSVLSVAIVGAKEDNLFTPRRENLEVVKVILENCSNEGLIKEQLERGKMLELACQLGCYKIMETLLPHQKYFFVSGNDTILHMSAKYGTLNEWVIEMAKKAGLDIDAENFHGKTALYIACENTKESCIKKLLEYGADISKNFLFHLLANSKEENIPVMSMLLHKMNILNLPCLLNIPDEKGCLPLYYASKRGHINYVKLFLQNGGDLNSVDMIGNNILHSAALASEKNLEIIDYVLGCGLSIDGKNKLGQTALHRESEEGAVSKIKTLVERGASVNERCNIRNSPLHYAVAHANNNTETIQFLVDNGAEINVQNVDGDTPLNLGCKLILFKALTTPKNKPLDISNIKCLLDNGADTKIINASKESPLHCVLKSSCYFPMGKLVDLLIRHGTPVNSRDGRGKTALHLIFDCKESIKYVEGLFRDFGNSKFNKMSLKNVLNKHLFLKCAQNRLEIIDMLLSINAEINAQDNNGQTPLHIAQVNGAPYFEKPDLFGHFNEIDVKLKLMQKLFKVGADVNIIDNNQGSVLHYEFYDALIEMYIKNNGDVNIQNQQGETALHIAVKKNTYHKVKILLNSDVEVNLLDNKGMHILDYELINFFGDIETAFSRNYDLYLDYNIWNEDGRINLHRVLEKKIPKTFPILKQLDVNAQFKNEARVLHYACKSGRLLFVKFLIENGASTSVVDNQQRTILHYAAVCSNPDEGLITYLIDTGVDIYSKDLQSHNALDVAYKNKCWKALRLLIETKKFFNSSFVSISDVFKYCVFGGCVNGTAYISKNIDVNQAYAGTEGSSLDVLKTDGVFNHEILYKVTKITGEIISEYGGYDPERLVQYFRYQILHGHNIDSVLEEDASTLIDKISSED